jgi:hypothetical protein
LVVIAAVAVGLLPPAFELCSPPHAPPGKKRWWKANAGVAIMTSINAETNPAARTFFTLLNPNLLWSLPYVGTYT